LAALGGVLRCAWPCNRHGSFRNVFVAAAEFGNRSKHLTPMTKGRDPEFFQVLICKIGQDCYSDVVLGKALSVLTETQLLKPIGDLLHRGSTLDYRALSARIGQTTRQIPRAVDAPARWQPAEDIQ